MFTPSTCSDSAASSMCTRSERPRRQIRSKSAMKSGWLCSSSAKSSTTTRRVGSGGSSAPRSRYCSYSATPESGSAAPTCVAARRRIACRRSSSPASTSRSRVTRPGSSVMLVMTAAVCGSLSMPSNVVRSRKSVSSRLTWSGCVVATNDSSRVRRNSDFPEPTVPTTMPCGPAPDSAYSFMSR